ncbi:hypothetical protein ACYZFF_15405 [Klebsiella variicola]|jgi:hypothetical protein|uniref:hypothetical protein n=1 Tax=Klebsiella pneumoniae complex TaxID=3390273 RepID=UPI0012533696|nr:MULTISPECIES: hypothetical protein [Klebsiella]HBR1113311.1 hypothetical protein [Klebsiella quasipneumoniae subsp. similipneumoniae]HBS1668238.1 hypothetical protein [Klebsiella quasipneumoniae subsp. quasipneumoniae]MBZ7597640.1 hypothetical protein [Klebsiella variicola]MDQ5070103.1 hypothetical protein [Klebsiella variicola subsp. variicola]MEB4703355.1 hypothetical protein [Klebsiella quasipneumoniae]
MSGVTRLENLLIENQIDGSVTYLYADENGNLYGVVVSEDGSQVVDSNYLPTEVYQLTDFPEDQLPTD